MHALNPMRKGKKWHHEFDSTGGVGLFHSMRIALGKSTESLLLLEEDFHITDEEKFVDEVQRLYAHQDEFDVASFGVANVQKNASRAPDFIVIPRDRRRLGGRQSRQEPLPSHRPAPSSPCGP